MSLLTELGRIISSHYKHFAPPGLAPQNPLAPAKFECIYVRPTNGRVELQLRRNRATQYFSFPDFKFDRLRKDAPGEYESYVDIGLNEWIDLKIEVKGVKAKLFVNGSKQPVLIVNDLKHGADLSGAIGLWVEFGTEGYFADLKIRNDESKK